MSKSYFDDYFSAYHEMLYEETNHDIYMEKLITFNGKAYPKYGNVVIMAGGGGSGKGFQIANMLGIDGKIFDIDQMKQFILKSKYFQKIILEQFGVDIFKMSLSNPEDTKMLHKIIKDLKIIGRYNDTVLKAVAEAVEKPNLIFDKTCSAMKDIISVSTAVQEAGYDKEHIHLVLVLTSYETALIQNMARDRKIPEDILKITHVGTSHVFNSILTDPSQLNNYVNGDIYISFNQAGIDTHVTLNNNNQMVVTDFEYVKIKEAGNPMQALSQINQEVFDKIAEYVPTPAEKYLWKNIKEF